ncbi:UBX domain-containing protein [Tieghemostelium lacteum]|uniref:UBX domain-containing protein n=1 Tax=Tieghemostelium lacteum TaxID=361077 RepID=A0A151ZB95_TIELA|nr:UBX domain-containing protein [Tieghemostelium lacteum]|eukprot:KYQ91154.1 UBX domain-containing protein [Tieghemostelium lacteum]
MLGKIIAAIYVLVLLILFIFEVILPWKRRQGTTVNHKQKEKEQNESNKKERIRQRIKKLEKIKEYERLLATGEAGSQLINPVYVESDSENDDSDSEQESSTTTQIIKQQNREYRESLKVDRIKEQTKRDQLEMEKLKEDKRKKRLDQLKLKFKNMETSPKVGGPLTSNIQIKLPNGQKIIRKFLITDTIQVTISF